MGAARCQDGESGAPVREGMSVESSFVAAGGRLLAEDPDVEAGRIFRSDGLRLHDHFLAFVSRGDLVLKLPADRVRQLVTSGAGRPFDAGKGRPMKEWVRVQPETDGACFEYLLEALAFARKAGKAGG